MEGEVGPAASTTAVVVATADEAMRAAAAATSAAAAAAATGVLTLWSLPPAGACRALMVNGSLLPVGCGHASAAAAGAPSGCCAIGGCSAGGGEEKGVPPKCSVGVAAPLVAGRRGDAT